MQVLGAGDEGLRERAGISRGQIVRDYVVDDDDDGFGEPVAVSQAACGGGNVAQF